jgi:hypothetical protein
VISVIDNGEAEDEDILDYFRLVNLKNLSDRIGISVETLLKMDANKVVHFLEIEEVIRDELKAKELIKGVK